MQKQNMLMTVLGTAAFMALGAIPVRATSYHVAVAGSDQTGTGTSSNPFASIQRCAVAAHAGDTVCVGAGTYYIPEVYNATLNRYEAVLYLSTSNVTFKSEPGSTSNPVVSFGSRTAYTTGVEITGSNIVWNSIDVNNGSSDITVLNCAGVTIENCTIQWAEYEGIKLENVSGVTVTDCNVHDCSAVNQARDGVNSWSSGIVGWSATSVQVLGSSFHNNYGEGIDPYIGCSQWTIYHNTVYDNYSVNIYIDTDVAQANMTVDNNMIYDTGTVGSGDRNLPVGIRIDDENADYNQGNTSINAVIHGISVHDNRPIQNYGGIQNCGGGIESSAYEQGPFRLADSEFYNNCISGTRYDSNGNQFPAVEILGITANVTYEWNQVTGGAVILDPGIYSSGNY